MPKTDSGRAKGGHCLSIPAQNLMGQIRAAEIPDGNASHLTQSPSLLVRHVRVKNQIPISSLALAFFYPCED